MGKYFISILVFFYLSVGLSVPTAIAPVVSAEANVETVFTAADITNGNSFSNPAGDVILVFMNDTAGSAAIVILTVQNSSVSIPGFGPVTKANQTCSLATGDDCIMGPFPPVFWNDGNSLLQVTYTGSDAGAEVSALAIKP